MARYTGAVCRLCRREGTKLFLKGTKCLSDRCPIEKRNFPPGMHGKDRKAKIVGYGLQLHEKQKAKRMYFTLEGQFREYYEKANRATGVTGELLIQQLERRLDNVAYRLGFAISRRQARQVVRHGHVTVNGKKVKRHPLANEDRIGVLADIGDRLAFLGDAPVLKISALTGFGVHRILPAVAAAEEAYHSRIPTGELNRAITSIQLAHPATGAKIKYAVQGASDPPTFTLFTNGRLTAPYLRYVERGLRERFELGPTPIKLRVRNGKSTGSGGRGGRR